MNEKYKELLREAYDPERMRVIGYQFVDAIADHLSAMKQGDKQPVLPNKTPDRAVERWRLPFDGTGKGNFNALIRAVIDESNHIHNPRYIGHQVTAPLPFASLCEGLSAFLNNSSAIYEMGPVNVAMEKQLIRWMCTMLGYDEHADGVFTSGGSPGNLTALLAIRQGMAPYDIWSMGYDRGQRVTIFVSEQCHYSIKRAVGIMGLGESAVTPVPTDTAFKMDITALHDLYVQKQRAGIKVLAVVANGCSTATGTYDDLEPIGDFCAKHSLWFHVDGAHGASAILSPKYRCLLKGIEKADSVVWDAHKMLLMPSLITAVLFRKGANSYLPFSQKASYLFEKDAQEEWYNYAHRTVECTKYMMGLRLYLSLVEYGVDFFASYISDMYDQARAFASMIRSLPDFELAVEPQSNIVCFRYLKEGAYDLDMLQKNIRKRILTEGSFYITQAVLKKSLFLRCVIINPHTTEETLRSLLDSVRMAGMQEE